MENKLDYFLKYKMILFSIFKRSIQPRKILEKYILDDWQYYQLPATQG